MLTFAKDKMDGFTQEYVEQFKHNCGCHFSNGPVDVGVVSTHNNKLAYTCEKCVAKRAAVKVQEAADLEIQFAERWIK